MVSRGHNLASSKWTQWEDALTWKKLLHVKKNKFGIYGLVVFFIINLWTMWSSCKLKNFNISLNDKKQNDICASKYTWIK